MLDCHCEERSDEAIYLPKLMFVDIKVNRLLRRLTAPRNDNLFETCLYFEIVQGQDQEFSRAGESWLCQVRAQQGWIGLVNLGFAKFAPSKT